MAVAGCFEGIANYFLSSVSAEGEHNIFATKTNFSVASSGQLLSKAVQHRKEMAELVRQTVGISPKQQLMSN
jgi:hypothetical protein